MTKRITNKTGIKLNYQNTYGTSAESPAVYRPIADRQYQILSRSKQKQRAFQPGKTLLGDLYEIVLDKKVIQERIRRGIRVPREEMFTEIPYYSPSGVLRTMPHSKYN